MLSWLNQIADAALRWRCKKLGAVVATSDHASAELPGFTIVACPSCERRLALHEDRIGDIIRCDEDTVDGCSAELLVTCEAYDKVTPKGGPARLRLQQLKEAHAPAS
jgi:hypothetical protein